jgi:hypothetical protein
MGPFISFTLAYFVDPELFRNIFLTCSMKAITNLLFATTLEGP